MEKVVNLIDKKISDLKQIDFDNDTIEFLSMFNCNITSLCKQNFVDLVMLFYMVKMKLNVATALEDTRKIDPFLEDMTELTYEDILALSDTFYELKEKYDEELGDWTYDDFISLKKHDRTLADTKKLLKDYSKNFSKEKINNFLVWMRNDVFSDILCFAACLKGIEVELEKVNDSVDELNIPGFFNNRLTRKFSDGYLKNVRGSYLKDMDKELHKELEELKKFKNEKIRENISLKRNINKQLKNLEELKILINNKSLTIEKLLKLTGDSELINICLIEIIKMNNVKFLDKHQQLINLEKNPVNVLEKVFNDYGYNFNSLTEEEQNILMSVDNNEKLAENLSFLSTSSLKFINENDNVFINILLLDMESLVKLDSLFLRGKLTNNFILRYGKKFNSFVIKQLIQNISKLDMQKIDFESLLQYNDKILLELDLKLLECISKYDIDFKNSNVKQYEFLVNPKTLNIINKFIELGLLTQIRTLPNLINLNSEYVIKRIGVMDELNISYLNERNTINQMARSGKDFYISDDMLDEYNYQNYSLFMNKDMFNVLNRSYNIDLLGEIPVEISFIEDYKKNEQVYIIGTQSFSRIKVLRMLKTLIEHGFTDYNEMLFNVLIYNYPSYLSMEIIDELKNLNKNIQRKQLK